MKKLLFLVILGFLSWSVFAQEIIFDDLPEPVQEDLFTEEGEYDNTISEDDYLIVSEKGYYNGEQRTLSTDTIYYYKWNPFAQEWKNHHRKVKTFNENEQLISVLLQAWNRHLGFWMNGIFKEFTYNDTGKISSKTVQVWHRPTQAWHNFFMKQFYYDQDTLLAEILLQKWHYPTQSWVNKKNWEFVYDDAGLLTSDTCSTWRPFIQEWFNVRLNEFLYDSLGNKEERISKHWHHMQGQGIWVNHSRALFLTDTIGMPVDVTLQNWRYFLNDWVNWRKVEITYNDEGKVQERLVKKWYVFPNDWANQHRRTFTYNINGDLDEMLFQKWVPHLSDWKNALLDQFTYDGSGSLIERLTLRWSHPAQTWVNFRLMQLVIDYKSTVAGIDDPLVDGTTVRMIYSNPYSGNTPVKFEGLNAHNYLFRVMNINGSEVYSSGVTEGQSVTLKGITPGLYIMVLQNEKGIVSTDKILISK